MNYYPFHIGDYLSATRHLSWAEDAAYRRLLDTYYTTEKALPLDLRAVCRLVLATTEEQREAVRVVLEEFFEQTSEGWKNSRADAEIEAMRDKQQKQRAKANKRWHKQEQEHGIASEMPRHANADAAAPNTDADAMPPTPTPTPIEERAKALVGSADQNPGQSPMDDGQPSVPTAMVPSAPEVPEVPTCPPLADLVALYHEALPSLPRVRILDDPKRRRTASAFWRWVLTSKKSNGHRRATGRAEAMSWIREFFERADLNDFLMGRGFRSGEHQNWVCDFDFLMSEKGRKHVIEKTREAA